MIERGADREVLDRRARELARPLVAPSNGEAVPVATFTIGGELYALETSYIRAVVECESIAALPGAPSHIAGVTSARDALVLVADVRPLLGLPHPPVTMPAKLFVCGLSSSELALVVEEINEMIVLDRQEIETPPWLQTEGSQTLILGVTNQPLILLDGARLLEDHRLFTGNGNTEDFQEIS